MRTKFFNVLPKPTKLTGYKFFFDMDGTLVDTDRIAIQAHRAALIQMKNQHQLTYSVPTPTELQPMIIGKSVLQAIHCVQNRCPEIKMIDGEYKKTIKFNYESMKQQMSIEDYIIKPTTNLLKMLCTHRYPVCIVSNADRNEIKENIKKLKLNEHITYVGLEDFSNCKPSPEPYLKATKLMGSVPSQNCIAFEDSENGVRSAKSAGMFVVGVAIHQEASQLTHWGADVTLSDAQNFNIDFLHHTLSYNLPRVTRGLEVSKT